MRSVKAILKNLFTKKVFTRQTRINLTDLHQVYIIPFDQSGKLINEKLMLKDISLEGFAIRASLEEWGFTKGMELEANLYLWDKVYVIRFKFLHLHDNFSGGKIVKSTKVYEADFPVLFEPELRSLDLLSEIKKDNSKKQYFNDHCGVQLDPDDFLFYYHNKLVRSYHGQIRVFDYAPGMSIKAIDLNHTHESLKFELEELHLLMRFLLTFKKETPINIGQIGLNLQKRFRKEVYASDK